MTSVQPLDPSSTGLPPTVVETGPVRTIIGDYSTGLAALHEQFGRARRDALAIQKRISGSEWADRYGYLPTGTGAETGRIRLYGYQRGLLDAFCDPTIPTITVMKSARVGYTRLLLLTLGYYIEHDPTTSVLVQPTHEDAKDFGRSEVKPLLDDTPALARLVRPVRRDDTRDTLTDRFMSNGSVIRIRGAKSDDAFRRYSARVQLADEIDAEGWAAGGAKSQGDKFALLWSRGETYWNRKQIRGGTPVLEESSRVWREFQLSDQRRYFVPCPHCNEMQYLEWGGPDIPHGLKWSANDDGVVDAAWYVCIGCGKAIDESHKIAMDSAGEWRPTAIPKRPGHVGFHLWAGMSLSPNAAWRVIAQEWIDAQLDPATKVQPHVNLIQGRPFKSTYGQELKLERFTSRREAYPAEVPAGVKFLTAGVDVQSAEGKDPRVEVSVYGWGRGHESWLIGHFILRGDPSQPQVWTDTYQLLKRRFITVDGRQLPISAAAVDSGGHHTAEVYSFAAAHSQESNPRIWAIKGASETNGKRKPVWPRKPSKGKNGGTLYLVGGNAARDFVYKSLAVEKSGPRYVHFPMHVVKDAEDLDDEFFRQLTRERRVLRKGAFVEWVKPNEAHEAGVCLVYAYAAVCGLQFVDRRYLKSLEIEAESPAISAETTEQADSLTNSDEASADDEVDEADDRPEAQTKQQPRPEPVPTPVKQPVDAVNRARPKRRRRVISGSF